MTLTAAEHIQALDEYTTTSQEVWRLESREDVLKLDWNESTAVTNIVRDKLIDFIRDPGAIKWYPDVEAIELNRRLAAFLECSPMEISVFGGSDMALSALCQTYLTGGDTVVVIHPGYDNFRVYAEATGASVTPVQGGEDILEFDQEHFIESLQKFEEVRMIYLINPNNPVGYFVEPETIRLIASEFSDAAMVVDEAYIEFVGFDASCVGLQEDLENVVVARSFSKAFGLAGLRLGYLVSDRRNLAQIRKIRNGKNVSMLAQVAGKTLLEHMEVVQEHVARVRRARQWFLEQLEQLDIKAYSSNGNFVLLEVSDPQEVIVKLRGDGVYARDRSYIQGLESMIRISIGYERQMAKVIESLTKMPADICAPPTSTDRS